MTEFLLLMIGVLVMASTLALRHTRKLQLQQAWADFARFRGLRLQQRPTLRGIIGLSGQVHDHPVAIVAYPAADVTSGRQRSTESAIITVATIPVDGHMPSELAPQVAQFITAHPVLIPTGMKLSYELSGQAVYVYADGLPRTTEALQALLGIATQLAGLVGDEAVALTTDNQPADDVTAKAVTHLASGMPAWLVVVSVLCIGISVMVFAKRTIRHT